MIIVTSVTRLDAKYEQTVLRASCTRLDTIGRSVDSAMGSTIDKAMGSTMGSAVESTIGRSMGNVIGISELIFVFELIENVVSSIVILFSNCR